MIFQQNQQIPFSRNVKMQRKREIFSPIHLNSIFIEFSWFHYIIQAIIGLADSCWLLQSYDTTSRTHSYAYLSIKCTISTLLYLSENENHFVCLNWMEKMLRRRQNRKGEEDESIRNQINLMNIRFYFIFSFSIFLLFFHLHTYVVLKMIEK